MTVQLSILVSSTTNVTFWGESIKRYLEFVPTPNRRATYLNWLRVQIAQLLGEGLVAKVRLKGRNGVNEPITFWILRTAVMFPGCRCYVGVTRSVT